MIDFNVLNKNDVYCFACIKQSDQIPDALQFDEINQRYLKCANPKHARSQSTLRFVDGQWKLFNGYGKNAVSYSESNVKTAAYLRQHKLGLFNEEFHQRCIDTQIKNGTFNMLQPEFSNAHHQRMKENGTGIFSQENMKYIHSPEARAKAVIKSNTVEHQAKRQETLKRRGVGIYDDRVRQLGRQNSGVGVVRFKKICDHECFLNIDGKWVLWQNYKHHFYQLICNVDMLEELMSMHLKAMMIPTFRQQNSIDWSKANVAFEQSLIEAGIGWFAYVKFYIDPKKRSLPLVVGKSGSKAVNNSGSDLSFSTDPDDGPGRKFLSESNLEWNKTQVLIIPCDTERQAYDVEQKIQISYNLFGS
jgi:hypothetical protein